MKHLLVISFLTFSSLLQAQYFDTFIGLQAGAANQKYSNGASASGEDYGLRLGFIRDSGRLYLGVNTAQVDDSEFNSATLSFDAITPTEYRFNNSFAIRGFIGMHGGFAELSPDEFSKDSGAFGGGQGGILLDFPASITVELGVKASWSDIDYGPSKLNNFQTGYVALDYIF